MADANPNSGWFTSLVTYFAAPDVAGITTLIGTIGSLAGLAFTFWVFLSVRTIRAHFLFAARVPQILQALQDNASSISRGLSDYDASAHLIEVELAKCDANLRNLSSKVKWGTRRSISKLRSKINHHQLTPTKERARNIYTMLNGMIQELQNLREDSKWSDANG